MKTIPRTSDERKPRFWQWERSSVGWRTGEMLIFFCPCGRLHCTCNNKSTCRSRHVRGWPLALAVRPEIPKPIHDAINRNRWSAAAREQLRQAFAHLDELIAQEKLSPPTLVAFSVRLHGLERWAVHCRYCRKYHFHSPGDGARCPHCPERWSPYHKSGYRLRGVGAAPEAIRRDMRRRRARGFVLRQRRAA